MSESPAPIATFDAYGKTFTILRRPPTLLLSELGRTSSGDPEAVGVIAEFFEVVLGSDGYRAFKRASYAYEGDNEEKALGEALSAALEVSTGTPMK